MLELGISNIETVRAAQSILEKPRGGVPRALTVLRIEPDGKLVALGGPIGFYLLVAENAVEEFKGEPRHLQLEKGVVKSVKSGYFDFTEMALVTDKDPIPFTEIEVDYPDYQKTIDESKEWQGAYAGDRNEFGLDLKPIYDILSSFDAWPKQSKFWFTRAHGGRAFLQTDIDGLTILVQALRREWENGNRHQ